MAEQVTVSVRNLVEFILRSGDIDNTRGYKDPDAMQEGSRIHRKIQKSMPSGYEAEVSLKIEIPLSEEEKELLLTVEGRADGIWHRNETESDILIDEIKSMYLDLSHIAEPIPVHQAQAKCYAYIYAKQHELESIGVQMTYVNIETEAVKRFEEVFTKAELEEWFYGLVKEYSKWLFWQMNWTQKRNESIKRLRFPFEYRPGQKDFVTGVYKSILREKKLFVEAPTGVGKTISTIFPTVKAMGEGLSSKLFYLTAKTIARTVAEDTFSMLSKQGVSFRFVTITSKEKICILDKPECNPGSCERAKGHLDRVNDAVFDMLTSEETITRELIEQYAAKHRVCPFEMCLDVSTWADAVICDYNYVFDPTVALKRFFAEEKKHDFIFLIDEAHNLVERAREMYSAELVKENFLLVKRLIKGKSKKMEKYLDACNTALLRLKRECESFQVWDNVGDFVIPLMRLSAEYEDFLADNVLDAEAKEAVLDLYFALRQFVSVYEVMGDEYRIYTDYTEGGDFRIKLLCMEPAKQLKERMEKGRSAVLFSATLLPISYYKEQLGGSEEDYAIYVPSPFDAEKRLLMVGRDVSTKYTRRTRSEYEKIALYLDYFVSAKTGNYFVFFPSYQMMEQTVGLAEEILGWKQGELSEDGTMLFDKSATVHLYVQKTGMTEKEKEQFLAAFAEQPEKSTVGFCVMGGIFGEGIDLKNDRLIGTVVVGTGLPMVCDEKELFRFYFDEKNGRGFDYAYLYPGMNKVMQSAGRVIRTTEDTGAVLLLDERFLTGAYQNLFPREWFPFETVNAVSMKAALQEFWRKNE
ncbi:MAG: ATP-dependent DNA helicase [Lachnospiraceae bacterium]|nr:ATP-dependent DNA helicase [Lachnospiraceae bacterium]